MLGEEEMNRVGNNDVLPQELGDDTKSANKNRAEKASLRGERDEDAEMQLQNQFRMLPQPWRIAQPIKGQIR